MRASLCILLSLALSTVFGARTIEIASTPQVDDRLLAQQKLLTDAVSAVFVALKASFEHALTNQLQTAAVLAAYTNTLDAAQAEEVAAAIDQWSMGVTTTLSGFLDSIAQENADLRAAIARDVQETIGEQVGDAVASLATGQVEEDVLTSSRVELLHNCTRAVHARTSLLQVDVRPPSNSVDFGLAPPRYTSQVVVFVDSAEPCRLEVVTPPGTSLWTKDSGVLLAPGSYNRLRVEQLTSSLYTFVVEAL